MEEEPIVAVWVPLELYGIFLIKSSNWTREMEIPLEAVVIQTQVLQYREPNYQL